jgi:hypothetical protein
MWSKRRSCSGEPSGPHREGTERWGSHALPDPARRSGRSRYWARLSHAWEGPDDSALYRILPLTYAGDRLGGAERDLARARGIAGDDRTALIGSITAILERQPAAELGPKSAGAVVGPRGGRLGMRVRRPGPGGDRGAELGQLPTAGHHRGRCEPHHLGLVPRRVGRVGLSAPACPAYRSCCSPVSVRLAVSWCAGDGALRFAVAGGACRSEVAQ